jgi:hypothetical protein
VLREKLSHTGGIGHGIVERRNTDRGRASSRVGVLTDHKRYAARLRRGRRQKKRRGECNNASQHLGARLDLNEFDRLTKNLYQAAVSVPVLPIKTEPHI